MNILIHIGYHKTGSTWLQQELFVSHNNIFEPFSLKNRGHSTLGEHFINDKNGYLLSSFDNNFFSIQKEVNNILKIKGEKFKKKYPVLSSERLSGNPHSGGFDAFIIAKRLKKVFPTGKIFIVIREQKSFFLSHYFQYVNQGGMLSIKKYLNRKYDGKIPFFSPNHINYYYLIKTYFKLFGKSNVLVLPYEMFKEEPEYFIRKLESFLNCNIEIEKNAYKKMWNKRNYYWVRYHLRFLNLFRKNTSLNPYYIYGNRYIELFIERCIIFIGKIVPNCLNNAIRKRFNKIIDIHFNKYYDFEKSNRKLNEIIDIDLSKYGYYEK